LRPGRGVRYKTHRDPVRAGLRAPVGCGQWAPSQWTRAMTSHLGGGTGCPRPADVAFRRHRIELNELLRAAFIDGHAPTDGLADVVGDRRAVHVQGPGRRFCPGYPSDAAVLMLEAAQSRRTHRSRPIVTGIQLTFATGPGRARPSRSSSLDRPGKALPPRNRRWKTRKSAMGITLEIVSAARRPVSLRTRRLPGRSRVTHATQRPACLSDRADRSDQPVSGPAGDRGE
jgi:hypothetical protein